MGRLPVATIFMYLVPDNFFLTAARIILVPANKHLFNAADKTCTFFIMASSGNELRAGQARRQRHRQR